MWNLLPNNRGFETGIENVLLITVDTLRADHLGAYGYPRQTSPTLDHLARKSVLFTRCLTPVPKTGPALASLMTSNLPERHHVYLNEQLINQSLVTLADHLRESGFYCSGIQSNGICRRECGFARGFHEYLEIRPGSAQMSGATAREVNQQVLPWLRNNSDKPFFLWVHYLDPHGPYNPPVPFPAMFKDEKYDVPCDAIPISDTNSGWGKIPRYQAVSGETNLTDYLGRYDAEIRFWDYYFKDVLTELKSLGHDKDTVIIISADHGESLVERNYYFEHGAFLYDENIHVPLLIIVPRSPGQSGLVDGQVSLLDIAPTITELTRTRSLKKIMGQSLVPWIYDPRKSAPRFGLPIRSSDNMMEEYRSRGYSNGTRKYTEYFDNQSRENELFVLESDPLEKQNRITQRSFSNAKIKFRFKLTVLREHFRFREPVNVPPLTNHDSIEQLRQLGYIH